MCREAPSLLRPHHTRTMPVAPPAATSRTLGNRPAHVQQRMATQPQRPPPQRGRARAALPLAELPPDALHTVLRGLSAEDLTRLPRVCRALRGAAADGTLWRRLYYARWGAFSAGEEKILGASFWKVWVSTATATATAGVPAAPSLTVVLKLLERMHATHEVHDYDVA